MKALEFRRSVPRYLAVRVLAGLFPSVATSPFAPLRLGDIPEPPLPGPDWVRVRTRLSGICGSDLATLTCSGSTYFSAVTSFPFVLGHEIAGEVSAVGSGVTGFSGGERVIVEPALGCRARGIDPPCLACAGGNQGNCSRLVSGRIAPGVQTGYCASTGGGWGESLVAHVSQIHRVPEALSDEDAVLVEPFACAIHAVLRAEIEPGSLVLVLGAGSVGLLTLLALGRFAPTARVLVAARHPHQAAAALRLGAAEVLPAGHGLRGVVVERARAALHRPFTGEPMVLGGVDATFDCVGTSRTLDEAVRLTRARGTVVLVGMPGRLCGIEGTALWFKETRLLGAYAYGAERREGRSARTFELALAEACRSPGLLASLVTARFRPDEYRRALATALAPGTSGAVKTVFDWR